ncbi:MAG: hypothetical protein KKB50_12725 [Planctomycetes bacterium]|nr:hypothetical protein [Planctomycetota bacterium]
MRTLQNRIFRMTAILALGGTCLASGCSLDGITSYIANFNPCGTILECNPLQYRFVASGYEGPGVDPDVTPYCVWPPFCLPAVDPIGSNWP